MTEPSCPICGSAASGAYPTPDPTPVRRCRACGARWVWPAPAARVLRDRYRDEHERGEWSRRFEETAADEWDRRAGVVGRSVRAGGAVNRVSGRPAGGTAAAREPAAGGAASASGLNVLDVGCGDGRFLDAIARLGWRTLGSEIALPGARLASGRHRIVVGELAAIARRPLFHAITFWDVLEHLPDPSLTVREAARRLHPGGVLAISMPNVRGSASLALGPRWSYYDFAYYGHLHHLSPRHLERLVADAGMVTAYRETRGSVDLRDAPQAYGLDAPSRFATWALDRLSGVVARVAEPLRFGNTTVVVGRKPLVDGGAP